MYFKRIAQVFLLSAGICVLGVGCSAVNALVGKSTAGSGATGKSPERYAAIARVFENQGRYAQAQAMYRQALKSEPGNKVVRDRLEMLAARGKSKTTVEQKTEQAIALADRIDSAKAKEQPGKTEPHTDDPKSDKANGAADSVIVKIEDNTAEPLIQPASATARIELAVANTDEAAIASIDEVSNQGDPAEGLVTVVLQDLIDEVRPTRLNFAPAAQQATDSVQAVSYSAEPADPPQVVTLADAVLLMDAPQDNRDELLRTIAHGEDAGVKALAAVALSSFTDDAEVEAALQTAATQESAVLRLSALESLLEQQSFSAEQFDSLLELLAADEAETRLQAAVVIRRLAASDWETAGADAAAALLNDPDPAVVAVAAATLGDFPSAGPTYRNQLADLVQTAIDEEVANAAQSSLNRLPAVETADVSVQVGEAAELQEAMDVRPAGTLLPVVE
ncbi:MAG: hypothetical protein Fues2KO_35930 [Fuerstiella sp.]